MVFTYALMQVLGSVSDIIYITLKNHIEISRQCSIPWL